MLDRHSVLNETARTALKTLRGIGNFVVAITIIAGALGAVVVALAQPPAVVTSDHPVMIVALTGSGAILAGACLAAVGSGALIYAFASINSATRKAKSDLEEMVMQGMVKIRSSQQDNTTIWKALDPDASDTAPGIEIQRSKDVKGFFSREILEKLSQISANR